MCKYYLSNILPTEDYNTVQKVPLIKYFDHILRLLYAIHKHKQYHYGTCCGHKTCPKEFCHPYLIKFMQSLQVQAATTWYINIYLC